MTKINQIVLMSGADYFSVEELNPYSHKDDQPDLEQAKNEFAEIKAALQTAGVTVRHTPAPEGCQDGIYTANWGLCCQPLTFCNTLSVVLRAGRRMSLAA